MRPEINIFYPKTTDDWREWLIGSSDIKQAVWIFFYKKKSGFPGITWSDAVDEALCFGWIDSKKIKIDDRKSYHYFSKRKANGTWSKINKDKIEKLLLENKMAVSELRSVEQAKKMDRGICWMMSKI